MIGSWLPDVRELAAIDAALHGPRLIVGEFMGSIALCTLLGGLYTLADAPLLPVSPQWQRVLGLVLLGVGTNFLPLAIYAVRVAGNPALCAAAAHRVRTQPELVRRYTLLQFWLLVPVLILMLATVQLVWRGRPGPRVSGTARADGLADEQPQALPR